MPKDRAKDVEIPPGPWLTLREGAAYCRMAYTDFTNCGAKGEFPRYRVPGKRYAMRVKKEDLNAWLASQRVPASA